MNNRITENISRTNFTERISAQRSRLSLLQEYLATNKRINRPSDDPGGAEVVLNLKTSLEEIEQFKRNTNVANQKLLATDDSLNNYENILERLRTLVSQGLSDTTTQSAKNSLATEVEALRGRVLNLANSKYDSEYLFGGTRQNAPPFDLTTAVSNPNPATASFVQIEPGANAIAVTVTAENLFSDATSTIFNDLDAAAAALRGTGNPATDRTTLESAMDRLSIYRDMAVVAHAKVGANMRITEMVEDRLGNDSLSINTRISEIEDIDFAETALALAETQKSLDAILQTAANSGRRSLFDFLG